MTELTAEQAEKLALYREAKAKIAEWQAVADELAAEFRAAGPDEYTVDGEPVVTVTPTRKFSPEFAKTHLPPQLAELCTETTITAAKAKRMLPPELYEACQQPVGKPTVRLV